MSTNVEPCVNDCTKPALFPGSITNRPGLSTIRYRIGTYHDLREHMLALLDTSVPLHSWTHRLPDDPGIALLESAAEVGDILTFYHELYANEAYLRTAKWRETIADLVRLLGYQLAPGLGGRARFALSVKGERPVTIPAGFGIKAHLLGEAKPAVFETSGTLMARPALSQFHFYRPRLTPPIWHGDDTFTPVLNTPGAVTLKAGDRIMVGVPRAGGVSFDHTQILVVDKTWDSFGATVVKMKVGIESLLANARGRAGEFVDFGQRAIAVRTTAAALDARLGQPILTSTTELRAWKLSGSFRHFGHSTPPTWIELDTQGRATPHFLSYIRNLATNTGYPLSPTIAAAQMPLDGEVAAAVAGALVLIEANFESGHADTRKLLFERTIAQVDRRSFTYGGIGGASTVLMLANDLAIDDDGSRLTQADIRGMTFHQVDGAPFVLHAAEQPIAAAQGVDLDFYGVRNDAEALKGRTVLLAGAASTPTPAGVLEVNPAGADPAQPAFHRVRLDHAVLYAQYDHDDPAVTVYGNLVEATQGKTEDQVTLGDGDARLVFQTFPLPKTPLTYLLDATQAPSQLPELSIWVERMLWKCVPSLLASGPTERVYVVREDAAGKSYVQFGDGKTGARLPSGRGNVLALFRTGTGAHGPLKPDAKPQGDKRIPGFDAAFMLEPATGGAQPESEAGARIAAPGTMQSLGRIVSLADYEAEALAVPGVLKARAVWTPVDGVPLVRITILTDSRSVADAAAAADALRTAVASRGASRASMLAVQGKRRQVSLSLSVGFDPTRRIEDVRAAILLALGAAAPSSDVTAVEEGLFGWRRRQFGQEVHGSHVVASVQNVPGVVWVRLESLGIAEPVFSIRLAAQPDWLPSLSLGRLTGATRRVLLCDSDSILALDAASVSLSLSVEREGTAP